MENNYSSNNKKLTEQQFFKTRIMWRRSLDYIEHKPWAIINVKEPQYPQYINEWTLGGELRGSHEWKNEEWKYWMFQQIYNK
jgi:hypothetical protein